MEKLDTKKFIQSGKIKNAEGTITQPENAGLRIILNPCAMSGKWETKLQNVLANKWVKTRQEFKGWSGVALTFKPGNVQPITVQSDIWILNYLCLDKDGKMNQEYFVKSLKELIKLAKYEKASIHISMLMSENHSQEEMNRYKEFSENGIHTYFYNGDKDSDE